MASKWVLVFFLAALVCTAATARNLVGSEGTSANEDEKTIVVVPERGYGIGGGGIFGGGGIGEEGGIIGEIP